MMDRPRTLWRSGSPPRTFRSSSSRTPSRRCRRWSSMMSPAARLTFDHLTQRATAAWPTECEPALLLRGAAPGFDMSERWRAPFLTGPKRIRSSRTWLARSPEERSHGDLSA